MVVGDIEVGTDVLIAGAGPAGYTAAIRCARLGLDVTLVNRSELGGVCLHKGCIPVKTLLYIFRLADQCRNASAMGIQAENIAVDQKKAQQWKEAVIRRLETGIRELCLGSGVQLMEGSCSFLSPSRAVVTGPSGTQHVNFRRAVLAMGGRHKPLPGLPYDNETIIDPDRAHVLEGDEVTILGAGYPGMTLASLLAAQGKKLTIIYQGDRVLSFLDEDMIGPVLKKFEARGAKFYPTGSWTIKKLDDKARIEFESKGKKEVVEAKKLVPTGGMLPNTDGIGLENTGVKPVRDGFITTDEGFLTGDPAFYAIGDVRGMRGNASTAFSEGLSVAEILAGKPGWPKNTAMPLTISTDPEIASTGLSENAARRSGIDYITGKFPFTASGKAVSIGRTEGFVKVVAEKGSHRILGVHMVGEDAFDVIEEGVFAIEMGARLEDIILTLHPHPTLCEAIREACAAALGESTSISGKSSTRS
jgi:dihydrolipoamide dehydrogenase